MTIKTTATQQLSAQSESYFELKKIIPDVSGTIFADYSGTLDLGGLDMQKEKGEYNIGSGFTGILLVDSVFYFCNNFIDYYPAK